MSAKQSVTVLGLGPMGRATVRLLLEAGHDVTVWNRTPGKAEALAELGAKPAAAAAEAVAASDTILLSLIHYDAMYGVLEQADLAGKTVVNLSSDSPVNTVKGADWVLARGARFLTGAYMTQGDNIAHPVSKLYVSGPKELHEELRPLLEQLCANVHLGSDYGVAQLYYQAGLARFHAYLLSLEQSIAMIERSGGDIDLFLELGKDDAESQRDFTAYFAETIKKGGGMDDAASNAMMVAGAQHVIDTAEDAGVDAALSRTLQAYHQRAVDATERTGTHVSTYQVFRGDV